jgi:hypothetical protein
MMNPGGRFLMGLPGQESPVFLKRFSGDPEARRSGNSSREEEKV